MNNTRYQYRVLYHDVFFFSKSKYRMGVLFVCFLATVVAILPKM